MFHNQQFEEVMHMDHIEAIASIAHATNKAYCETIRDFSQPNWSVAPKWQKDSAIDGVRHTLENPESTPEDSHKTRLKLKESEGWVYGPVKDAKAKTHHCMVPYSKLPEEQRIKDALFQAVVRALAPLAG